MKIKLITILSIACLCMLIGCGKEDVKTLTPEQIAYRNSVNEFCNYIAEINSEMDVLNSEDTQSQAQLLNYLDNLNTNYRSFAEIPCPEEYSDLKALAIEGSEYMDVAYDAYTELYTNDEFSEEMIDAQYDYATENFSRAYKRIQVIVQLLNQENEEY